MQVDRSGWSGDGDFTIRLLETLKGIDEIEFLRVEDAPASRSGTGYNLLANEIYLRFATRCHAQRHRWLGVITLRRTVRLPRMTLGELAARLASVEEIGEADYGDEGMLQYMRTERIIPPYQTRGYKLVELVRVYQLGN